MTLIYSRLSDGSTNPAWLEARRGRITASEVHRVMGTPLKRGTYLLELLTERLVGQLGEQKVTEFMQTGIDREVTDAPLRYEDETGRGLIQGYWIWDEKRGLGGTPDFIVEDGGGIEVKCPQPKAAVAARFSGGLGAKWRDEEAYYWQCVACRLLTGEPWWELVVYSPELDDYGLGLYIDRIEYDEEEDSRLVDAVFEANAILIKQYDEAMMPKRQWVEKTLIPAIERATSHEAIQELENEVYKLGPGALPPGLIKAIDAAVRAKTRTLPSPIGA